MSGAGQEAAPASPATLMQAGHPNPFRSETTLHYTLPHEGRIGITVLDVQGRRVAELVDGEVDAGGHVARWDGADATGAKLAAGIYYVRLDFEGRSETQKIVLTR